MRPKRVWEIVLFLISFRIFYLDGVSLLDSGNFLDSPDSEICSCPCSPCSSDLAGVIYPKNYNKLEIPILAEAKTGSANSTNLKPVHPLNLKVGVYVRKVCEIDEIEEEVTIEIDLVTSWLDELLFEANRASFNVQNHSDEFLESSLKTLDGSFLEKIWKPDLFIEQAISITKPELFSRPVKLKLSPLGRIIYAMRVTVKMDCEMEFYKYPADTQHCIFKIRSYSHPVDELTLNWMTPKSAYVFDRTDTDFYLKISNVGIINTTQFHHMLHTNYNETFNILQFTLSSRRRLSFHLYHTYIPTVLFIGITWGCFLVPASMVEIRIGVAMTTLLTLTSMFSSVRETSPVTSYSKAIDVWIVVCVLFILVALLEFALLVWLRYAPHAVDNDDEQEDTKLISTIENPGVGERKMSFTKGLRSKHRQRDERKTNKRFQNVAILTEEYAFYTFFLTFLLFQIIYWPWLLISSDYFNWTVDLRYNVED